MLSAAAPGRRLPEGAILVRLDSGAKVEVMLPRTVAVRRGHAVVLSETRTLLFGLKRHRFLRYAADPPSGRGG